MTRLKQALLALWGSDHMGPLDMWVSVLMARVHSGISVSQAKLDADEAYREYVNRLLSEGRRK